jgi:hypothetical protein
MAAYSTVYLWVKVGDHGTAAEVTVTGPRLHVDALKKACLASGDFKGFISDDVGAAALDVYLDAASLAAGTPLRPGLSLNDASLNDNSDVNPLILVARGT